MDNAKNLTGAVVLPHVAKSSDYFCERAFHVVFALMVSTAGIIILRATDVLGINTVAYFAYFLVAAGAYIHPYLIHAWRNKNNVHASEFAGG